MELSQVPNYVMSTLCRICAEKSSKLTPIFENESLPLKICKCLPIQVNESDYLPLKVCEPCFFKISESYTFYMKADEADQRLKKLWKILLNETMGHLETNTLQVVEEPKEDDQVKVDPPDLVINISQEVEYPSIQFLGGSHFVDEASNQIKIISKSTYFELIDEDVIFKSLDKKITKSKINETDQEKLHEKGELEKELKDKKNDCQSFPQQYPSLTNLKIQSAHPEEKTFLCDTCGKFFKSAKNLRSHTRTHLTIRKKHTCKVCGKKFLTNFFLQEHMNSHTGETPYKCLVCDKEFREKVHLRQHKWTRSTQNFVCSICGSKFNRKGNMTEHMKQHLKSGSAVRSKAGHRKVKSRKKEEEIPKEKLNLKCPACASEFPSQALLKSHLKIHPEQKRFFCSLCGKKFRHSGSLTYHRRTAHTGERPFQCSYCDMKFSLRSVQIIHERKTHTLEHPYKCTFCSRPFTNSSSLRNHLFVHSKDKMFACDECGKKFTRSSNLSVHKKLHSGERKFACDQCGKSYIQKHDLLKHEKVHDPKNKPFFCKYCGNSFSRKKESGKHALCQFDFLRKNNSYIYSAEKMLDSVTNCWEKTEGEFSTEEEHQLILGSVNRLSEEKDEKSDVIHESDLQS